MGIPAYFSNIIKRYPCIISQLKGLYSVDNLFMDCNSIIYDCYHKLSCKDNIETVLINDVINKLDNYIETIGGSKMNFLAFDGVGPMAKMTQQKNRRFKSTYEKEYFNTKSSWDTSAITPGTMFMMKLERELQSHYKLRPNVRLEFSSPGEGEHKIFDYIRQNSSSCEKERSVIYGLDSDLIMLSLQNHQYCHELYLCREMPEFIKTIDERLEPNEMYLINITDFRKYLTEFLRDSTNDAVINDYIFICFLLGNDFLPHFPAINLRRNGLDLIQSCYIMTKNRKNKCIIDNGSINWRVFREMVQNLAEVEEDYIKDEFLYRNKQSKIHIPNRTEEEKKNYFMKQPMIFREKEIYINPLESNWQSRYYYALFEDDVNIKDVCMNYLEGLEWTFKYYSKGCIDWRWKYKYHYPPLLSDLVKYIPYFTEDLLVEKEPNPVSELDLLAYVLPPSVINTVLYPMQIEKLNLEPMTDATVAKFEWAFCKYFWECHIED